MNEQLLAAEASNDGALKAQGATERQRFSRARWELNWQRICAMQSAVVSLSESRSEKGMGQNTSGRVKSKRKTISTLVTKNSF